MREIAIEPAEGLLSIAEASRAYGASPATIYRHLKAGNLRRFRGGLADRRTYVSVDELKRLAGDGASNHVDVRSLLQGRLVWEGRWPGPLYSQRPLKVPEGHTSRFLLYVFGTKYGIAADAEGRLAVNWFGPDGELRGCLWHDPWVLYAFLDDMADETDVELQIKMDRRWHGEPTAIPRAGPPTLEELRKDWHAIQAAAADWGARNVRVFGSVVRGDACPDSDVDFLVDFKKGSSALDLVGLSQELEMRLGRRVDVGEAAALTEPTRSEILREAVPL